MRPHQTPRSGRTIGYHQALLYMSPLSSCSWEKTGEITCCQLTLNVYLAECSDDILMPLPFNEPQNGKYPTPKIGFFGSYQPVNAQCSRIGFIISLMCKTHIKICFALGLRIISIPNHIRKQASRKNSSVKIYIKTW